MKPARNSFAPPTTAALTLQRLAADFAGFSFAVHASPACWFFSRNERSWAWRRRSHSGRIRLIDWGLRHLKALSGSRDLAFDFLRTRFPFHADPLEFASLKWLPVRWFIAAIEDVTRVLDYILLLPLRGVEPELLDARKKITEIFQRLIKGMPELYLADIT
jgi:hypothetical protein